MLRNLRSLLLIMLMFGILSACQAVTGRTAGETLDDATITTTVKAQLAKDKLGTLARIDVDTTNGVVALNGVVKTPQERARAEEIARSVRGVKKVINNLQIETA